MFSFFRFVADMSELLVNLEGSFEKLAECLHLLEDATDATLEPFLVLFFLNVCSCFLSFVDSS